MVERVYGVTHGLEVSLFGLFPQEVPTYPSRELVAELAQLPPGSSVGIETIPDMLQGLPDELLEVDGERITWKPVRSQYWKSTKEVCDQLGHTVVYLDDIETLQAYVRKRVEQKKIGDALKAIPHLPANEAQAQPLVEAYYKAEVEAEYIHVAQREEKMVEHIRKFNPTVVVIGIGHGDYLVSRDRLPESDKPAIYRREIAEFTGTLDYPGAVSYIDRRSAPDQHHLLGRELLERKYRAVMTGRVLDGKAPNFIGTWDTWCRPRGLFEAYIIARTGNTLTLTIEDCLGTGSTDMSIDGNNVSFSKRYDPSQSAPGHDLPIEYKGKKEGDVYMGEFVIVGENTKGSFTMQTFGG